MNALAFAVLLAATGPGPYVNVYHDDAVAFQVRRDRIKVEGEGQYRVWLRWLWAEPRPWKTDHETARVVVADVDCMKRRVRELAVLHKNREGKVYDSEELAEGQWEWKSFDPQSGAAGAINRLCEFLPELANSK